MYRNETGTYLNSYFSQLHPFYVRFSETLFDLSIFHMLLKDLSGLWYKAHIFLRFELYIPHNTLSVMKKISRRKAGTV